MVLSRCSCTIWLDLCHRVSSRRHLTRRMALLTTIRIKNRSSGSRHQGGKAGSSRRFGFGACKGTRSCFTLQFPGICHSNIRCMAWRLQNGPLSSNLPRRHHLWNCSYYPGSRSNTVSSSQRPRSAAIYHQPPSTSFWCWNI